MIQLHNFSKKKSPYLLIILIFLTLFFFQACVKSIPSSEKTAFAIIINQLVSKQNNSNIDSTIYNVSIDTKNNQVQEIYSTERNGEKTLLQKLLQKNNIVLYQKDLLLFNTYAEAKTFLDTFLPYISSFIHTDKIILLREEPSVNAVLKTHVPSNVSLYVISSPYLQYNEKIKVSSLSETKKFTKAVNTWIKVRYKHNNTYTDAWTLITNTTLLQYEKENPFSSISRFSNLSVDTDTIWRSKKDIMQDNNSTSILPAPNINNGIFINTDNVISPYLTIQTYQTKKSLQKTYQTHFNILSKKTDATIIALSQILPYTQKVFLIPSRNMQISVIPNKEIILHYSNGNNESYYPFSSRDIQISQIKNSINTLTIENTLTRYNIWSSAIYGKIQIFMQQNPRALLMDWSIPKPLSSQYSIENINTLQSIIITNTIPDVSLKIQVNKIIALIHPNKSQYIFFAINILSNTEFTLQHITSTISSENTNKQEQQILAPIISYTKEFDETLTVQGNLSGPIMIFTAIQ